MTGGSPSANTSEMSDMMEAGAPASLPVPVGRPQIGGYGRFVNKIKLISVADLREIRTMNRRFGVLLFSGG